MKIEQSIRQREGAANYRPHLGHGNQPDFSISGSGTVYLFEPLSETAQAWLKNHCPAGSDHQYLGRNLAVEFRYVAEIIRHAICDGLKPAAELMTEGRVQ